MRSLFSVAALLLAISARAETLTFEQVLTRAMQRLPALPDDALRALETAAPDWPAMRVEASWSDVRKIDIVHDSLLFTVDYHLLDGGARELRRRASRLAAQSFRERHREAADRVFEETVDAFARLYAAQERRRILEAGFERALSLRARADEQLLAREISSATAAQWQDEAIAAEAQLIDVELQRLEAEARVKRLIGSDEEVLAVIDLAAAPPPRSVDFARDDRGLALDFARAARKPQVLLSAFGGFASLPGESRSPLVGMRVTLGLPMFDAAMRRREAEARLEVAAAQFERPEKPADAISIDAMNKRIALLQRAVEVAKARGASLARLHEAGLRSEASLAAAMIDVAKRESELLAARVERWRLVQLAR